MLCCAADCPFGSARLVQTLRLPTARLLDTAFVLHSLCEPLQCLSLIYQSLQAGQRFSSNAAMSCAIDPPQGGHGKIIREKVETMHKSSPV
jgi:hypothetical protein